MGGGVLYVRIIEAKGLPTNRTVPPDPYCTILIDNNPKTKHKTKRKKKTCTPVWEEEFRYEVEHKDHVIHFQVSSKSSGFRSSFPLGSADVSVESLKPAEENILVLELKDGAGLVGTLHLAIIWAPLGIQCPPHLARKIDRKEPEPASPGTKGKKEFDKKGSGRDEKLREEDSDPLLLLTEEDRKLGLLTVVPSINDGSSHRVITAQAAYGQEYDIGWVTEGSVVWCQVGAGAVILGYDTFRGSNSAWFRVDDSVVPAQLHVKWIVGTKEKSWSNWIDFSEAGGVFLIVIAFLLVARLLGLLDPYLQGLLHTTMAMGFACLIIQSVKTRSARNFAQQQLTQQAEKKEGNSETYQVPSLLKTERKVKLYLLEIKEIKMFASEEGSTMDVKSPLATSSYDKPLHMEAWGGWCEADPAPLFIRGPNYLQDRKKIPAIKNHFELMFVDISHNYEGKLSHAAARPDSWVSQRKSHEDFVFVVNWQLPGSPRYNVVCYFQAPKKRQNEPMDEKEAVFNRTLEQFLDGDQRYRDTRFKMIPRVVEGNWVVQRTVGTTPAILGTKMGQNYFENKEKHYFEVDVDIGTSKVAGQVLKLVKGYAKTVVVDLSFLIEGQSSEELPEQLLGGVRLYRIDVDKIPKALSITDQTLPAPKT